MENNCNITDDVVARMKYIVRRLTPTECERLSGLPDGYTVPAGLDVTDELVEEFQNIWNEWGRITAPGKKPKTAKQVRTWLEKIANPDTCPDAPRYKTCGNGWATNQPRWILFRMLDSVDRDWMDDEVDMVSDGAIGYDGYNMNLTGAVSMTVSARGSDPHHVPCVVNAFGENTRKELRICGNCSTCIPAQGGGKPGQGFPAIVEERE